jgi:hypothetical protein
MLRKSHGAETTPWVSAEPARNQMGQDQKYASPSCNREGRSPAKIEALALPTICFDANSAETPYRRPDRKHALSRLQSEVSCKMKNETGFTSTRPIHS